MNKMSSDVIVKCEWCDNEATIFYSFRTFTYTSGSARCINHSFRNSKLPIDITKEDYLITKEDYLAYKAMEAL